MLMLVTTTMMITMLLLMMMIMFMIPVYPNNTKPSKRQSHLGHATHLSLTY